MITTAIFTDKLLISPFTIEDAPFLFELMNSPSWLKFIGDRGIKTVNDAKDFIFNKHFVNYKENGFGSYKVTLIETGNPIGTCGFFKREGLQDVDLGFAFLPEYEGQGFAFESATTLLEIFQKNTDFKRVVAITLPENTKSIALLERLGFHEEKSIQLSTTDEELMLFGFNWD